MNAILLRWPYVVLGVVIGAYACPPSHAQSVFPPMTGGDFVFSIQPAPPQLDPDGIPLVPFAESLGIVASTDGALLGCVPSPDQLASYQIVEK